VTTHGASSLVCWCWELANHGRSGDTRWSLFCVGSKLSTSRDWIARYVIERVDTWSTQSDERV
jgi:hypothetical protein